MHWCCTISRCIYLPSQAKLSMLLLFQSQGPDSFLHHSTSQLKLNGKNQLFKIDFRVATFLIGWRAEDFLAREKLRSFTSLTTVTSSYSYRIRNALLQSGLWSIRYAQYMLVIICAGKPSVHFTYFKAGLNFGEKGEIQKNL